MSPDAVPPTSRRALRAQQVPPSESAAGPTGSAADGAAATALLDDAAAPDASPAPSPRPAGEPRALAWVDESALAAPPAVVPDLTASAPPRGPDLLAGPARRSPLRPGVLAPIGMLAALVALYVAATLLWPLTAVAPRIEQVAVQPAAAPAFAPAWPDQGTAAISVEGAPGSLASGAEIDSIASITKVVTALLVLDAMPLAPGEQGPEYAFTAADNSLYWQYRRAGESALDVPVNGTLTQYQLIEGMLVGSANNYADRLAEELWPTDAVFADAANRWLATHGIPGITIADPSGIDEGNVATAEALLPLAATAMAHPVIAEMVGRAAIDLPGAGEVRNTNALLEDPGVVGIKTGTLAGFNLLSAKDVSVGGTIVRVYAAVLGQDGPLERDAVSRALFAQAEEQLQPHTAVTAGTLAGRVVTRWGEPIDVVVAEDAAVPLWNGGAPAATTAFDLGDAAEAGDRVGELSVVGPWSTATVALDLADDLEGPSPWWRLTHPLELLGLG